MAIQLLVIEETDALTHVALWGKLDIEGVPEVEMKFLGHTAARKLPTIVDMAEVTFIASIGMGMLIESARSLKAAGATMVLLNCQELVGNALSHARIDKVITMCNDLDEAKRIALGP